MTYIRDIDNDLTYDSVSGTYVLTSTIVEPEIPEPTNTIIQELVVKDTLYDIHGKAVNNKNSSSTNPVYTWVGTLAEYQEQNIKQLHPSWICNILDLPSNNINVYDKTETNSLIQTYPKKFLVCGQIANSQNGTLLGIGQATVILFASGLAEINYEYKITTAGTVSNLFLWGLNRDLLQTLNSNIPLITPEEGGHCSYYNSEGNLIASKLGYAGINGANSQFWPIARIYTQIGDIGNYPETELSVEDRVVGIAYGKFSV